MLAQKFEVLSADPNAGSRGRGLELFLAELFGREHFRVEKNLVAGGRQIDLYAIRGTAHLLVEAKWTKRRSQHEVIDQMRARLERAAPNVVGLVVSMSGFSETVIERIERSTERPVLLMNGREVEEVVRQGGGLHSLVQWKMEQLQRHRKVAMGSPTRMAPVWLSELPEAGLQIIDPHGRVHPWWESRGGFCETVGSLIRPDAEWARDGAVRLDMSLGVRRSDDLVGLLKRLAQLGWISSEGAWRIEQSRVTWSGFGAAELARQLTDWTPRYRGRQLHHSEQAIYVDECDEGMLTIIADLSATSDRLVRWCELSFLLAGVPLDPSPYEALTSELPVMNVPTFRVQKDDPLRVARLTCRGMPKSVKPLAFLVRNTSPIVGSDDPAPRWVEGIVVNDPMPRASTAARIEAGLPGLNLGQVFVQLQQHHHLDDDVAHHVSWATSVQAASAQVFHVLGDWAERPRHSGRGTGSTRRPSTGAIR